MEEMEKEIIYLRNQINMLKICLVITQVSAIIVLVSLLYQYSRLSRDYQELLQTCQGFLDTVKVMAVLSAQIGVKQNHRIPQDLPVHYISSIRL